MGTFFEDPDEERRVLSGLDFLSAFGGVFHQGRLQEAREILLKVLPARSFQVTPEVRARIDEEHALGRLESWILAAVNASTIDDVFSRVGGEAAPMARRRRRSARGAGRARPA